MGPCDFSNCLNEAVEIIPFRQYWERGEQIALRPACVEHVKLNETLVEHRYEDLLWYLRRTR